MSSAPFSLSMPVIDNPNENSPKEFVLRCKNEDEYCEKMSNFLKCISPCYTVMCHRIGYRPDKPVPVARLFYEIKIKKYDPLNYIFPFWTHAYTGRKEG